tara:strand:- start:1576 stop:1749 length:174 start_codon:yes stop_codon:yes gene_type:complete
MVYWTLFIVTLSTSGVMEVDYTEIAKYNDRYTCEVAYTNLIEIYEGDGVVVCDKTDQ